MSYSPGKETGRSRLQQTLGQWQAWQCQPPLPGAPHVIGPLKGGLSNHNFLVSAATRRFVVRIDGINPAQHGLNRQLEWRVLQSASAEGIAPTPRYFNPELGAMVVDYLEADPQQAVSVEALAALLRDIHQLPPGHHRVDIAERIQRYQHRLQRDARQGLPRDYHDRLQILLHQVGHSHNRPVMTHNDLLPANLICSGGRLLALDWEYCGMGSPWFDLAVASLGQDLQDTDPNALLALYLGTKATGSEQLLLRRYRAIARYLELLWHLAESPADKLERLMSQGLALIDLELG